ncbi:MAG: ABC transporter permease [Planctomycetales bacterium]|nr:ABC transporter permease [Planctomycetales bacterium]
MLAIARNPILWRELFGILRTPRALVLLCLLVVAMTGLVALRWPESGLADIEGNRSRQIYQLIGFGLTSGMLLMAPAFPSTSIVSERKRGTLALLFNSPLTPAGIYGGKFFGSLLFLLLVMLTTLPTAAASYAMGGVSFLHNVLPLYLILALMAIHYTAVSLAVSAWSNSTDSALRTSYGLVLLLAFGSLAPYYFTRGTEGTTAWLSGHLYHLSPVPVTLTLFGMSIPTPDFAELTSFSDLIVPHLRMATVSSLVWIGLGLWLLHPNMLDRSRAAGVMTDDRKRSERMVRGVFMLIDPQRRSRNVNRFVNPLLVKEMRTRRFGRSSWMLRLVFFCAIVSIAVTNGAMRTSVDRGLGPVGTILVALQVTLMVLLTPSLTAGLISAERESGGWPLLQMTPMSAVRIVSGKLMSVVLTLLLILMATLPGYVFILAVAPEKGPEVVRVVASLALVALFCLLVGAVVGSLFRRSAPATACAYAVLLAFFGGTLLIWLGRDAPFGYDVVRSALLLNPAAAALSVIGTADFATYDLLPYSWYWTGAISGVCLIALVFQSWRLSLPE